MESALNKINEIRTVAYLLKMIQIWIDDLECIKEDPVHGDPDTTIKLVTNSMQNLLNRLEN